MIANFLKKAITCPFLLPNIFITSDNTDYWKVISTFKLKLKTIMTIPDISWKLHTFQDITVEILYEILKLRQEVFVVEQECAYLDCDDLDKVCLHLSAWRHVEEKNVLAGYIRIIPPQSKTAFPALGRLLTRPSERDRGLGREIMERGLILLTKSYPKKTVRISAQQYLVGFYSSFGFRTSSDMYLEDGIPHIEMILEP